MIEKDDAGWPAQWERANTTTQRFSLFATPLYIYLRIYFHFVILCRLQSLIFI